MIIKRSGFQFESVLGTLLFFYKKIPHFSNMIEFFPYLLNIAELIPLTN
jgi:hypothetical protein